MWGFCLLWREAGRSIAGGTWQAQVIIRCECGNVTRQGPPAQSSCAWHFGAASPQSWPPAPKKTGYPSHTSSFFLVFLIVFNRSISLSTRTVRPDWWQAHRHARTVRPVSCTHFSAYCAIWDEKTGLISIDIHEISRWNAKIFTNVQNPDWLNRT